MKPALQLTGLKFGRLKVIVRSANVKGYTAWLCRCDCGTEKIVLGVSLHKGHTKSCGCFRSEIIKTACVTHGARKSTAYDSWAHMIQRCTNENNKDFLKYGGRGITICKEWIAFANFYKDMGEKPDGFTLDRINNDGNYEKSNCRWADRKTQRRNNSANVMVEINGKSIPLVIACEDRGLKLNTVYMRIRRGSSAKDALEISL